MRKHFPLIPVLGLLLAPAALHAASSANQEQEYEQVRKIALRDPKVREAYADADRKLQAKIAQIDPALANYTPRKPAESSTVKPASATTASGASGGFQKPAAKPAATASASSQSYAVVHGDTLTSIAGKYGVTVADLKAVNHITDEKKLGVGQVLVIPNAKSAAH
jgi:LysM repeat protein